MVSSEVKEKLATIPESNGYSPERWKSILSVLSTDEAADLIVSELKFVNDLGERWGTYNAAASIQRGLATPEEVLAWPQAQDDYAQKRARI